MIITVYCVIKSYGNSPYSLNQTTIIRKTLGNIGLDLNFFCSNIALPGITFHFGEVCRIYLQY